MNYARTIYVSIVALSLMCTINSYAEDESGLFFDLLTTNPPNTSIVVSDPDGKKTGLNLLAGSVSDVGAYMREIPNSYVGYEASPMNVETGEAADTGHVSVQVFNNVSPGDYDVLVYASTDTVYRLSIDLRNTAGEFLNPLTISGLVSVAGTVQYAIVLDPTLGASNPVITKVITFDGLRNDVSVARQLNQLGDEKFARSLIRNIDLAEMLAGVCGKRKGKKEKPCQPAIAVLKLFVKRLELANRKCDEPSDCDEEHEWAVFRKEHGKDDDFKDFFREWDRDDWHKHKKKCRRFVTDEALKIIKEDTGWLIKSLGEKTGAGHDKPGHGGPGRGKGGKD